MAGAEIHIDPVSRKQLNKKFNMLPKISLLAVYDAMIGIGMDLVNQAKLNLKGLHVITSRLMNSIYLKAKGQKPMDANYKWDGGAGNRDLNVVIDETEVAYGTNVEYGEYIEKLDSYIEASTNIYTRSAKHHLTKAAKRIEKEASK